MINLRKCTAADLNEVRKISGKTYQETFAAFNTSETMAAYLNEAFAIKQLQKELSNPASFFYFIELDGQIAGYLKINEAAAQTDINDPVSLEVERIYVLKAFQGKGLGHYLLNFAQKWGKEAGKEYLWLGVWEQNFKALHFYQQNGFFQIGVHDFVMGDEVQKDFILRKDLA